MLQKESRNTHALQLLCLAGLELKALLIIVTQEKDPHDWKLYSCYCGDGVLSIAIPTPS